MYRENKGQGITMTALFVRALLATYPISGAMLFSAWVGDTDPKPSEMRSPDAA